MRLVDAIFSVTHCADNAVICSKQPFAFGAEAVVTAYEADYRIPAEVEREGFVYFLGKEDVVHLLEEISGKAVSREVKAEFVAHFAAFDAYPQWFKDLPDV